MEYFAGIDVSLEQSSVCVVDGAGKIVREAKVASEPEALAGYLAGWEWRSTGSGWRRGRSTGCIGNCSASPDAMPSAAG